MAVQVYDPDGQAVLNEMGELVCEQAFPSMPLGFWGDDEGQSKYRSRVFREVPWGVAPRRLHDVHRGMEAFELPAEAMRR